MARTNRSSRRYFSVGFLCFMAALVVADHNGWLLVRRNDDVAAYHGRRARIVRAIDGDTFDVDQPDALNRRQTTRVRLWGVNCPEIARAGREAEPWGDQASEFARALLERVADNEVILWLEPHQTRDGFGAVLAHLELPDGSKLNEALLEAGLARIDERWPHSRLIRYAQLERAAKRRGAAIWSN